MIIEKCIMMHERRKMVSILGDSISTFEGCNPSGYCVFYDKEMQSRNGLSSVYDTWWAQVIQELGADLCVNNSYSGSKVTGGNFPSASSDERVKSLHTVERAPDIILIYIGFNDFGNGVRVKGMNCMSFESSYDTMLSKMKMRYPDPEVICGTLMKSTIRGEEKWEFPERFAGTYFEDYNDVIRKVCKKRNCIVADLENMGSRYETLDGSHPTIEGHKTIANSWISCLRDLSGYGVIFPEHGR